ncbi:MAG: hypothetical protein ACFN4U_02380 [Candidatus Absconditicoccaceae bacterium]
MLALKSPFTPGNVGFSGFFLYSPFVIIASLAMTGLKYLDCHASLAMTGLKSVDCHTSLKMTEKKDQIFVFYKRKAVKDHINS